MVQPSIAGATRMPQNLRLQRRDDPSPAQQELLRETWQRSGVASWELANGSLLGDPIELGAIEKVHGPRPDPFLLMSGKCNKGHGEGVAGMTTFLKILFFLQDAALKQSAVPHIFHFSLKHSNC
eukprot:Skav201315  [mRNA]  locus=scaffold1490:161383:165702:- [translate_table: standard]